MHPEMSSGSYFETWTTCSGDNLPTSLLGTLPTEDVSCASFVCIDVCVDGWLLWLEKWNRRRILPGPLSDVPFIILVLEVKP